MSNAWFTRDKDGRKTDEPLHNEILDSLPAHRERDLRRNTRLRARKKYKFDEETLDLLYGKDSR